MISCVILNLGTRRGHRKIPFGTLEDCIRIKICEQVLLLSHWAVLTKQAVNIKTSTKKRFVCKNVDILDLPSRERSHIPPNGTKKNHGLQGSGR